MATVLGLNIKFAANTAGITKGADRTEKSLRGIKKSADSATSALRTMVGIEVGKLLAAGFTTAVRSIISIERSIENVVNKVRESTRELTFLADQAGTTEGRLQRLSVATGTVGIDQEKLADILKDVNDRVGDFLQTGAGPMADFFENIAPKVGLTVDNFKNLSGPQALQLYVKGLEDANVNQQEFTFYLEAIASDSIRLLPLLRNNGAAMEELAERADRLGIVLSTDQIRSIREMDRALGLVSRTFDGIIAQVVAQLSPIITDITNDLLKFVEQFRGGQGGAGLARAIVEISLQGIETFLGIVTSVGNSLIFFGEVAYKVGERVGWLVGMKAPQQGVGAGGGGGGGGGWGDDAAVEVADAFGMRMRESLEKVAATIQKSIDNIRDRLADAPEVQADAQIDVEPIFEAMVKSAVDLSRKAAGQAQEAFSSIGTRLQESFEQIKRVNEELAPLYEQLSDAEESRIDALSENTRRALEVSDIRSGGIASVIALATGREDPALDEARKQSRRLEEIKAEIRNLGGTVEIAGAA